MGLRRGEGGDGRRGEEVKRKCVQQRNKVTQLVTSYTVCTT